MEEKILIAGAGGFLGKYVSHFYASRYEKPEEHIDTLGISPTDTFVADLTNGPIDLAGKMYETVIDLIGSCHTGNLRALNVEATRNLIDSLNNAAVKNLVYISSTEIYGAEEGSDLTEGMIADPVSEVGRTKLAAEQMLVEWAKSRGITLTILRVPEIVGTGMKGALRYMVNSIYRASYHHVSDEIARLSVVHAVDVARVIPEIAPLGGTYNLTDGVNPTMHDLTEAFAYRLAQKRIFTLSPKYAKLASRIGDYLPITGFTTDSLARRYRTLTFSCDKLQNAIDWIPTSVTEYLRTHNYDQNSL